MTRRNKRLRLSVLFALCGWLLAMLGRGWHVDFLPLPVLGYLLLGLGFLGLLDVNIFWGGPLDKRLDPEAAPLSPAENLELKEKVHRQGEVLHRFTSWVKVLRWAILGIAGIILLLILLHVI